MPLKPKVSSVRMRRAFKVVLLVRKLSLATKYCVDGSKKHTGKHFCRSVK